MVPPPTSCACCGSDRLSKIGEDVTETLEVIPRRWKVIQTVREKFTCRHCEKISQPPAPFHATPRGWAGPNLLAMIVFDKYGQYQPLNRQRDRYAREGVDLSLSDPGRPGGADCGGDGRHRSSRRVRQTWTVAQTPLRCFRRRHPQWKVIPLPIRIGDNDNRFAAMRPVFQRRCPGSSERMKTVIDRDGLVHLVGFVCGSTRRRTMPIWRSIRCARPRWGYSRASPATCESYVLRVGSVTKSWPPQSTARSSSRLQSSAFSSLSRGKKTPCISFRRFASHSCCRDQSDSSSGFTLLR